MILCRLDLAVRPDLYHAVAEDFQELPMYFMTYHGQESVDRVLEVI